MTVDDGKNYDHVYVKKEPVHPTDIVTETKEEEKLVISEEKMKQPDIEVIELLTSDEDDNLYGNGLMERNYNDYGSEEDYDDCDGYERYYGRMQHQNRQSKKNRSGTDDNPIVLD